MKKKYLLAILPTLLILSACQAGPKMQAKDNILEDATAHSEIFGVSQIGGQLGVRKRNPGDPLSTPKIGYQINYNDGTGKMAIRFVAAIKDFDVKAEWKRGVSDKNGNVVNSKGFSNAARDQSTHYYTTLSNGTNTLVAGEGDFSDYTGFVVYTLYNINYSEHIDSFVAAYLTITDLANDSIKQTTSALAVKVEKADQYTSACSFVFDPAVTGHFLAGTIGGVIRDGTSKEGHGPLRREDEGTPGTNFAWYENVPLQTTDSFGSFYYSPLVLDDPATGEIDESRAEIFQFFGFSSYFGNTAGGFFKKSGSSEFTVPYYAGTYDLYVSGDEGHYNHIYGHADSYVSPSSTIYFDPGCWDADGARFNIWYWGEGNEGTWGRLTEKDSTKTSLYTFELPSGTNGYKFVRMNGSGPDSWEKDVGYYNQSGNYNPNHVYSDGYMCVCNISGWDGTTSWALYSSY